MSAKLIAIIVLLILLLIFAIQNIIDMCNMALEEIDKGKREERDNLTEKVKGGELS